MGAYLKLSLLAILLTCPAFGQRSVTFPVPGSPSPIQADRYGSGSRALILAHGGRFDRKSWAKQAAIFANAGFTVLAISFRGDRFNPDGSPGDFGSGADNATDALAAAAYLHRTGAKTVSAIGGSFGGDAVGDADAQSDVGVFDRVVFLGSYGGDSPARLKGRKLFIVAREDTSGDGLRLPGISKHYEQAPQPKKLLVVEGSAHAQFLFATEQGPQVMKEILSFLSAP